MSVVGSLMRRCRGIRSLGRSHTCDKTQQYRIKQTETTGDGRRRPRLLFITQRTWRCCVNCRVVLYRRGSHACAAI